MLLQPHLPLSGETGAAGPSAFPLVVRGGKLEPGLAAKQPWEALSSALEILRRMNIAAPPIAQVSSKQLLWTEGPPSSSDNGELSYHALLTDIRLFGATGETTELGRGQVFYNGRPLCNAGAGNNSPGTWDVNAANVVCRMLGFPRAREYYTRTCHFGDCTADDWILSGFNCTGTENRIIDCPHESTINSDCDTPAVDMVGVDCIPG